MIEVYCDNEAVARKALKIYVNDGRVGYVDFGWNTEKTEPDPTKTEPQIYKRFLDGESIHENEYPNVVYPAPHVPTPEELRIARIAELLIADDATAPIALEIATIVAPKANSYVRSELYRARCDKLYSAYLSYTDEGETAKATAAHESWVIERAAIASEFPDE